MLRILAGRGRGTEARLISEAGHLLREKEGQVYVVVPKQLTLETELLLIRALEPDVLIKGGDWSKNNIVGADLVEARGGRVLSLPLLGDFSTTAWLAKNKK